MNAKGICQKKNPNGSGVECLLMPGHESLRGTQHRGINAEREIVRWGPGEPVVPFDEMRMR